MNLERLKVRPGWIIFLTVVISVTFYLAFSSNYFQIGFPLDDAWIHQTYARNLVEHGSWSYRGSDASGGSTSPLWTALLSLGYALNLPPKLWAYLLGASTLFGTALVCVRWMKRASAELGEAFALGLGLVVALEWHLVWAAVSGMETLLMGLLSASMFMILQSASRKYLLVGLLIGLGVWIRPDAVLLLVPGFWISWLDVKRSRSLNAKLRNSVKLGTGALLIFIPYLGFNYLTAGLIWPTTFFAKQAEYQALLGEPLLTRLWPMFIAPLVGVGVVLLPGFLFNLFDLIRKRQWIHLAPFIWVGVYFAAYAFRLPVTYQHGRYLMPILPVSIVLGFIGLNKFLNFNSQMSLKRVISRTWIAATYAILITFWGIGARAYARDVAIIESEMVAVAQWIQANTVRGAKIAAHDIGALGYYADRDLLDLAGLVSPQVIPIIRDEQALEALMNGEDVDYLVTFPDWYPYLTTVGEKLYETGATYSPAQGGENMTVYQWPQ